MLKATAGGGGKGMRFVGTIEEFEESVGFSKTRSLQLHLEMMVCTWRNSLKSHDILKFKLQVINTVMHVTLSERDCSIQRRHQKLVEETPSPFMTDAIEEENG